MPKPGKSILHCKSYWGKTFVKNNRQAAGALFALIVDPHQKKRIAALTIFQPRAV